MSVSMYERSSASSLGRGIPTHMPVTEDTPPDYLEGHMQLLCVLPNGKPVEIAVERRTPMLDVLVQICTSRRLAPGDHVLTLTDLAKQILPFKPSTPIGSLDAHTVHVSAKGRELLNGKVSSTSAKAGQPFESTIRLQVHLPRNQLHVLRVSPRTPLAQILHTVCVEKGLDPNLYEVRHPANVDERLRLSCCLADYKLQEITVVLCGNPATLSAADLPAMQSSKNPSRATSEIVGSEKKKKGIFGFVFGKKSRMNVSDFRSPPLSDELPTKIEVPYSQNGSKSSPSPSRETSANMPPPHPPTRMKKRPAPAPPPGVKSPSSPSAVNGSGSLPERKKSSSVISTSSSEKSGRNHSRQGSDSSSGYHESSVVSEHEPAQKNVGPSSLSDVAAPPRLRPKLANGVGQSPRAVSVINLSQSSALHPPSASNLTKMQSQSHTSLSSAGKKRKAPAPPPLSILSTSTISASTTVTPSVSSDVSVREAGTASHRSSMTDSTISATSSSVVSSIATVPIDSPPSRSSSSNTAASTGEKPAARQSKSRLIESQPPPQQPPPRASSSSSTTKTNLVNALSPPMQPNVEKAVSIPVVVTPPVPSPRKKYAMAPLPPLPVEDDLNIDDWSLFEQETALFPSSSSSSTSTLPSLVAPPKPRRQWEFSDESSRPESRLTTQTISSAADFYSISNSSDDDVTSVESQRTKQVRQLKKAFVKPDWSSPPSANPSSQAKVPANGPKNAQFTVPQYVQLQQGPSSKKYPNDVRFGISSTDNSDNERSKRVRKRSSKEKKGQHMLRYSTRKYSTPSSSSSSSLEDDLAWRVSKTTSKGNPRLSASPMADKESGFKRSFSEGDFGKDDLASDSASVAASDFGPVMDDSKRNLFKSKSGHSMQMGLNRWEKVEVSDLSAWFDEVSLGLKSETSSEKSAKDQKTHSLLYRDSSAESGEDAIYERVKPMAKIIATEQKPQAGAREALPMEAIYSVVVKKPKAVEVMEKEEEAVPVPVKTLDRVQNGKIEALEAPKEPKKLPLEEDIAWEYKLPDPPTPFQDTPLLTIPDPVVSVSETLSRSLSSASESDRATSPVLEAKEVLDSVQDLRWQAGETRTEAEEVEEEVIVPVKVQKAPSLVVNGRKDENILVLTEKINEESQTDDLALETQVERQETVRVMQDEAVQCQDELAITPKERLVEVQVELHVTEEKTEEEFKTKLAPSVEKTDESQEYQAEFKKLNEEIKRREEQEEETAAIEELELTLQDYEDSPASFPSITVEIHQIPSESSSTTSGSRRSSISSHTDVEVHIVPALQSKATSPILRQSNSAALFTISSMKTELEFDLTDSQSMDSFDKETKRNSLSSLQKSESMALPIKPKLLKRQSSFGDGDQEPSTVKETPINTPPVSLDAVQTSPPVNVELFMQAQQLFSKAAENMGNQQLQEEFIRLQQQFITWQQQLLANQQVIQTKLTHSMQTDAPAPPILKNEDEKGPIIEENSKRKVQLAENVERKVEIVPNLERTVEIINLEPEKKVEIIQEQPKPIQQAKFHPEIVGEPPTMKTNSEIQVEEPRTVCVIEKPVDDVTSAPQIDTFPEDIPKEPVYRYQGPPTIKLEPWRPGRPRSEIIDFSRDSSFFLPDQLSQPSEPRKSVRELAQRSKLEQLIKPLTFPKPSEAKKIAVLPQNPSPEPQVEVVNKEEVEKRETKPLLIKQVTLPATGLVSTKTNDVSSPLPANFTDFAVPNIVSTQSSAPYRPTLVRRASIGTPRPFELKQAPLRKIQFPIRVPEVRGFAPLKPDALLSQSQAPFNPKPTNQMRDKLIVSARRPSAELKPLEMEELAKLGTKTKISPSEPTIPPPSPLSLPTLRPAHLRKPLLPVKSMLDPREELMIAIRSFGASGGLRKNENPLWSGQ